MLGAFLIGMSVAFNPSHAVDPIAFRGNDGIVIEKTYDTISDDSFQKFLDREHPFFNINYIPGDLQAIESDFTANNSRLFQLREKVGIAFADMAWHFQNDFQGKRRLSINTAYRSYEVQHYLMGSYCVGKQGQCAIPGTSEHQAGLALDLGVNNHTLDNASYVRLQENAYKWGFHNTYQKGIEVDGQIVEPWHWRYVGVELAKELYEKKQSLAERYYNLEK